MTYEVQLAFCNQFSLIRELHHLLVLAVILTPACFGSRSPPLRQQQPLGVDCSTDIMYTISRFSTRAGNTCSALATLYYTNPSLQNGYSSH